MSMTNELTDALEKLLAANSAVRNAYPSQTNTNLALLRQKEAERNAEKVLEKMRMK